MPSTLFADRFSKKTGILELMDDLGRAMARSGDMRMLGGGNPAHIPEMNAVWRRCMNDLLGGTNGMEDTLCNYDTPQGKHSFLESLAALLNREFGWDIGPQHIAVTNGSQTAFFILLNILAGTRTDGSRGRILFPLCPEYIGYADQCAEPGCLLTRRAGIELTRPGFFKYHVDFDRLDPPEDISAICISRPTNPTGNVLTDSEVSQLSDLAEQKGIPLIIDNAYGAPFPNILFREAAPFRNQNTILTMSLSKLGLPGLRTGIVVAEPPLIKAVSACNAVISLSSVSMGQTLVKPLIDSGEILTLSRQVIRPFYQKRVESAVKSIQDAFGSDIPYRLHETEGAMFLWLWLPELPVTSAQLYERLKQRNVLVVSGHYFFYGLDEQWDHANQCLRLSCAQDPGKFREAAQIMANEVRRIQSGSA